ncbi:uncharacterized protein LOC117522820 isoform X1 [Thalassophryne amazonica]|uniref:uncharacterized protein LOC117522820 isoform X1 n=2 Tax=Thalassophryne amazonica TaxID=390379 RepID=UPI001470D04E|nr:uncharacterized protein LOC117522820 isoform X1 [Thalassophryne amazonica]
MSQAGKVLHLYVEVRSVAEDEGKTLGRGDEETSFMTHQCPDILPHSQRSSAHSSPSPSPELFPVSHSQSMERRLNLPLSKSSKHSVSLQVEKPDATHCLTQVQFQDMLYDRLDQELQVLTPGTSGLSPRGSLADTCSCDLDPYHSHALPSPFSVSCERLNVPSTPTTNQRSHEAHRIASEEGKTSVVTFSYVDKANINRMGRRTSECQYRSENPFLRLEGELLPVHLQKRLSDPGRYDANDSYLSQLYSSSGSPSPHVWPYLQRSIMDAMAKEATHRAMEEFGSPELNRRFAAQRQKGYTPIPPPQCRSWAGSPVSSQISLTLPSKTQLSELHKGVCFSSVNGLPRSPASDKLSAHSGYSVLPTSARCPPATNHHQHSPTLNSKFHPPLPAGRPTAIQHEIPAIGTTRNQPLDCSPGGGITQCSLGTSCNTQTHNMSCETNDVIHFSGRSHFSTPKKTWGNLSWCSSRTNDGLVTSPSSSPEIPTRLSATYRDRHPPSPTPPQAEPLRSGSAKVEASLVKESHQYADLHGQHSPELPCSWVTGQSHQLIKIQRRCDSPLASKKHLFLPAGLQGVDSPWSLLLHPQNQSSSPGKDLNGLQHYQTPQYNKDHKLPGLGCRKTSDPFDKNTDTLPVSWTFRHQDKEKFCQENYMQSSAGSYTQSQEDSRQNHGLGTVQDCTGFTGTSSQSSSGVTGSLGDGSQLDRNDGLSPETSSHETEDSGSGMQSGDSLVAAQPSRSQKLARAKWEFLFGPREESCCSKGSSTTTPLTFSPTPLSSAYLKPTSHRRGWHDVQRLPHHQVQQIEVDLVTADLQDSTPKTGIIRRTIQYSETDLDAVPLRCYRETDLDEVMRAEAEPAEEADSAFGSTRSVLENSIFSPADVSPKPLTGVRQEDEDDDEEAEEEEEQEEEEEEGVVSWASVRMQGDRTRQRAAREETDVCSLLLKGPLDASSNTHGGLKSPISISSPRCPSDSSLDSFSRHFESIMESHRAKGTSYSSLDSIDLLTSGSTSIFTFDLPTLTPQIQSQICENAKQILDLSFAPLVRPDGPLETSRYETTLSASGVGHLNGCSNDGFAPPRRPTTERELWCHSAPKDGFRKATSVPSLNTSPREQLAHCPPELLDSLAFSGSDDGLANGMKTDQQAAKRLAKRLYNLDGFRKSDVAPHLSKNNDFSRMVAEEFLKYFNFSGLTIDQALRLFLAQFALMGETQERERVLSHFSKRYLQCNPDCPSTQDSVHTLTCAVMLLNSDLHGNNVGKRMSCSQFISNLEGLNDGKDFPKDLLKTLYSSIKNEKLQWTIDEEDLRKSVLEQADARTDSASHTMKRLGGGGNPLVGMAQQANGELYKSGFLVRKVHADPDGKRTPRGRRGWKSFYAMLKGLVLYLQKDEYRTDGELTEEDVKNAVSIHHSLAMRAADYSKRPNVFYLRTADWRVYLLQAPNAEQMQSWITRINTVAAIFSAPPFPAAIGSQKRFSRPLLPGSNTKLTQEEQVKSHETRFRAVSSELVELTNVSQERKVRGRDQEEQKLRQEYLEFEKTRYGTYAMLLRAKLSSGDEDLLAFESRLFDDCGLQRAYSSPTLPLNPTAKEKNRGTKTSKSLKVSSSSSKSDRDGSRKDSCGSQHGKQQTAKQEEDGDTA